MTYRFRSFACLLASFFVVQGALSQTPPTQPGPGAVEGQSPIPVPAGAPSVPPGETIVGLVNDEVITSFDLRQRIKLILLSSGGQIRPEQVPQLQQQALRDLVNEQIKIKELEKFEVKIPDREVNQELQQIAAQTGLTLQELEKALSFEGISTDAWRQQIRTSIGWQNLVQGRFRDRVKINEREVEQTLQTIRDDATKERYLVSELCIPVEEPTQIQAYYQAGLQLIEQMRRGVPFAAAAQQFSGCTSASIGGDIGWVQAGELPVELDSAIQTIPVGSVTNPIPSEGALIILALRDKKEPVAPGEPSFTLAYASAPVAAGENKARLALKKLPTAEVCNARAIKLDLGPDVGTALLENVKLSAIDPKFQRFIADLERGDLSAVIEADGYLHEVYICEKDEGLGIPSRSAIEDRIFRRQLQLLGQRYLRDLERKSTIEIRNAQNPAAGGGRRDGR
ncbi:MAG: peptidylprolyl isomerase [Pseudomonadota bacterium]